VRHTAADHVREGLPDFDLPGERMQRDAEARARKNRKTISLEDVERELGLAN
jgi:hypothetical protein